MSNIILIGLATSVCTLLGGLFALRFRDKLHLILGFSAGAVIGVAFFDLLPESISLASEYYAVNSIVSLVALGFTAYLLLDRIVLLHFHNDDRQNTEFDHRGKLGAGSFSIHSFIDGLAIGFSFKVSAMVGIVVAVAVLVHDFSDGINTVNMILKNGGTRQSALKWLMVDASAPFLGVISTLFFTTIESVSLGILLAVFCGFFLYIGASDLLPESHHKHPTKWTTLMTIFGILVMYVSINLIDM